VATVFLGLFDGDVCDAAARKHVEQALLCLMGARETVEAPEFDHTRRPDNSSRHFEQRACAEMAL
jgi:hypothetical protein